MTRCGGSLLGKTRSWQPILEARNLKKVYSRGLFQRRRTFGLSANFSLDEPEIVGVMGPNGSGKTTLFELLSGSNVPTSGQILCGGQDIQRVKYRERDRLVDPLPPVVPGAAA